MMSQTTTARILINNLRALMAIYPMTKASLAMKSGISPRMIGYILSEERMPTVEVVEALAKAFGLMSWHLLVPNLPINLAAGGSLDKLIHNYAMVSADGRDYINRVAEQEAKYKKEK